MSNEIGELRASHKDTTPKTTPTSTPELTRKQLHSVHSIQELTEDLNEGIICTGLHEAIVLYQASLEIKYLDMIKQLLLDPKNSPFITTKNGHSAIELVAKSGDIKLFDIIHTSRPLSDDQKFEVMLIAAKNIVNHENEVKIFMSHLVDSAKFPINHIHSEKQSTLLQSAAEENIFAAMSEILKLGATTKSENGDILPKNELETAAYAGACESFDALWDSAKGDEYSNADKFKLVLQASHSLPHEGSKNIIAKIIDSGFPINYVNEDGESLAMVASFHNKHNFLKYLIDNYALDNTDFDLAIYAAVNGSLESFNIIRNSGRAECNNFNTDHAVQYDILKFAVLNMNEDNLERSKNFINTIITEIEYDVNYHDEAHASLLCIAAAVNHLSTEYLLELGADPFLRHDRLNAAQIAAKNGNLESFAAICAKNIELAYFSNEAFPYNPLATAVLYFDDHPTEIEKFIRHLLSYKIYEVDSVICNGNTALIVAILEDKLAAAKILVSEGADVNIVVNGHTPFSLACEHQKPEFATYILNLPQFVEYELVVHDAIKSQNLELLQAVCAKYPQFINMPDSRGHTPLDMVASFYADTEDGAVFSPLMIELMQHEAVALLMKSNAIGMPDLAEQSMPLIADTEGLSR